MEQLEQVSSVFSLLLYVPTAQSTQREFCWLFSPAPHTFKHGPSAGPAYPYLHVQVSPSLLSAFGTVQCEHWVAVLVSVLYCPESHELHPCTPSLFCPGPHSFKQVSPSGPLQPETQLQLVAAVLPATLLLLSGQPVHDVAVFVPVLYCPVRQVKQAAPLLFSPEPHSFTQLPPSGPLQPPSHLQSVTAPLPSELLLSLGQGMQKSLLFAPSILLYLPWPQGSQEVVRPVALLKWPVEHDSQGFSPVSILYCPVPHG